MYFKRNKFVCFISLSLYILAHGYERKCVNPECSKPIAIVLTINNHSTEDIRYLQYSRDEYIVVYSYGNATLSDWDGKISEGRLGFFDPNQTKILKTLHLEENLLEIDNFKLTRELPDFNVSHVLNEGDKVVHYSDTIDLTSKQSSQDSFLASRNTGQESRRGPPPKDNHNIVDEKLHDLNSLIESKYLNTTQDKLGTKILGVNFSKNLDNNQVDSHNSSVSNQTNTTFVRGIKSFNQDHSLKEDESSYGMSLNPIEEQKIGFQDTNSEESQEMEDGDGNAEGEIDETIEEVDTELNNANDSLSVNETGDNFTSHFDDTLLEVEDKITADNLSSVANSIEEELKPDESKDFKITQNLTESQATESSKAQVLTTESNTPENLTASINTTFDLLDKERNLKNIESNADLNSNWDKDLNGTVDLVIPIANIDNNEYDNNYSTTKSSIANHIEILPPPHLEDKNIISNSIENLNSTTSFLETPEDTLNVVGTSPISQFFGQEQDVVNITMPTYTPDLDETTKGEIHHSTPIKENPLHAEYSTTEQPFIHPDKDERIVEITTPINIPYYTFDNSVDLEYPKLVPSDSEVGNNESKVENYERDQNVMDEDNKLSEVLLNDTQNTHPNKSQMMGEELTRHENHGDQSYMSSGDGKFVQKFNVCESKKAANGDIMHDPNCKKYMSDSLLFQDDAHNIDEENETTSFLKFGLNKVFAIYDQLLFNLLEGVTSVNLLASVEGVLHSNACQGGPGCATGGSNFERRTLLQKIFRFRTILILLFTLCGTLSFFMGIRKKQEDGGSETQDIVRQAYEMNQKLDDMTILLHAYQTKIRDLDTALATKEDEINELTANNSEYKDLKKRLETVQTENERLNDKCSRIPGLESDKATLETEAGRCQTKITSLEGELLALQMGKEKLEETHEKMRVKYEESRSVIQQLEKELEKTSADLEKACESAKSLEESLADKTHAMQSYEILLKKLNVLKNSGFQNVRKRRINSDSIENGIGKLDMEGEWGVDESDTTSDILLETEEPIALDETTIKELLDSTYLFKEIEDLKVRNAELLDKIEKFEKDQSDIKTQAGKKDVEVNHYKSRCGILENTTKELEGKLAFISKYFEDKECKLQRNINDLMNECDKYKKLNEELEKKLELLKRQADLYLENLDESKKEFYECQKDMRHRINELEDASNKLKITAHGFERKANHLQCENQNLRQTLNELEQNMDTNSRLNNRPLLHGQMDNDHRVNAAEPNDKVPHSDDNSSSSHASKRHVKIGAAPKKGKSKLGGGEAMGGMMPPFPFFPPLLPPMVPPSGRHPDGHTSDMGGMGPLMMPPFFMNPPPGAQYGKGDREGNMTDSGLAKIKGVNLDTGLPPGKKKSKKHGSKPNGHESDFSAASLSGLSSVSAQQKQQQYGNNNSGAPPPFLLPPPFAPFMMGPLPENSKGDASFSDFSQLASHSSPLQGDSGMIDNGQVKKKKGGQQNNKDRLV